MQTAGRKSVLWFQRQLMRDVMVQAFSPHVRLSVVQMTASAQAGVDRFGLVHAPTAESYTRTLTAATLLSSFLSGEERVALHFRETDSERYMHEICAEAIRLGEVRGFVRTNPAVPPDDSRFSPHAYLMASRVLYNHARPVQSSVSVQNGDITSDVQHFLEQSDQQDSFIHLESTVLPSPDGAQVAYCGGLIAQRLPEGDMDELRYIRQLFSDPHRLPPMVPAIRARLEEDSLKNGNVQARSELPQGPSLPSELHSSTNRGPLSLRSALASGVPVHAVARACLPSLADRALDDRATFRPTPIDFFCRCSKESFLQLMARMPPEELQSLETELRAREAQGDDPPETLECHYCNTKYPLAADDVVKVQSER